MKITSRFNDRIPKGTRANLQWRQNVHRRVLEDPSFAEVIIQACTEDPLFFLNGFGYTYDPRREPFPKVPFILYDPFQEKAITEIILAINSHDLLIEKSRDMGASWLCMSAFTWAWLFRPMQSFLCVSRVEDYVDKQGNPKALFWKFDFLLGNLPTWLRPRGYKESIHRAKLHIENPENGSVIDGESTTGNVARGDRRTAELFDEFAAVDRAHEALSSSRDSTKCRIFNSTPNGVNNAFYELRQKGIRKLRLHWSEHPIKSKGLYTTDENGKLQIIDTRHYPDGYEPILDGKLRSPWYDGECERAANNQEIAQELDIDYLGSGFQYFSADLIYQAIRKYARPPLSVGDLDFDSTTIEPTTYREDLHGSLELWCLLNNDDKPPTDQTYVVANDVSAGTGASNSAIAVWNKETNEKVAQYTNAHIRPEAMAKQAIALARWFGNALLIWESNGPGRQFGSRVMDIGYNNVYYRQRIETISKKQTDIPGWASTRETKSVLMGGYRAAVEKFKCVNRSKESLEECLEYIFSPDGSISHSRSLNKTDPSGASANHGDRVIADALAQYAITENRVRPKEGTKKVPIGCLAWRRQQREKDEREKKRDGW